MTFRKRTLLPAFVSEYFKLRRAIKDWKKRDFLENSPQIVKQNVFLKYGIPNSAWVESGTFLGTTTQFLAERFPHVYTIEPDAELFGKAARRFVGKNVTLFNGVSEKVLPDLLPKLTGSVNFWLDGHYSGGITFKGSSDCPVEYELATIEENEKKFKSVTILIDDVRCFLPTSGDEYNDYPPLDYLVDWARRRAYRWRIEHDIFIMQRD